MQIAPTQRLWKLLKLYNSEIKQIYVYALFIGMVNLTLPLGIQAIINYLQTGEYTSTWLFLVGFVLLGMTLTGILQVLQLRQVENSQQDLFARSAFEFAYRLPQISFIQLDKLHAPELVNRFFDTITLQKGLPKILIDFSLAIFQILFGLILLGIYSSYFVILGVILGVILWFIYKATGRQGLKTSLKESKQKYRLAHWLEEVARVNLSFKLYSKNKFHLHKTDDIVGDYIENRENHFKIQIKQYWLFIGFKLVLAAGLLVLGSFLVFQERINLGQFVAAEIVVILIINSVEKVVLLVDTVYDVLTGLEKIGYVADLSLDKNNGIAKLNKSEGLSVKANKISFGFKESAQSYRKNISFEVKPNEKIVLTGKSGAGKSMLLRVLSGIQPVDEGELLIDNVPLVNYKREAYFDTLGIAFHTNQIYEGTIKENILMGRPLPEENVTEVLQLLNLKEYINYQPKGIETIIDSGGRRLPRSVIQKIQIARILVNKPRLLILEDPLHFIEKEEKIKIIDYLMDSSYLSTIMVVSDFDYWSEKCDRIIDLNKSEL